MGGCPFHTDDEPGGTADKSDGETRAHRWRSGPGLGRRSFVKSAVAIGGMNALSAVLSVEAGAKDPSSMPYPTGEPSNRPEQQHRWSNAGYTDDFGNPAAPKHQVVLLLDYLGDDIEGDRETVETAFEQLERAFAYDQEEGLLFNVGYSPAYFKRHSRGNPKDVDITEPRSVSPFNHPERNRQDVFVQLASDQASIVLAAEEALLGEADEVNGVDVEASLADLCETDERRPVFAGIEEAADGEDPVGLPAKNIDNEHIENDSPLSMGFDSVYSDSIPPEEQVTITNGPWTDGTVAMVSKLRLHLDEWYEERDRTERVNQMFAPQYTPEDVGDFGEGLGKGSGREDGDGWSKEITDRLEEDAREKGVVGHSQKVTRARDDDFAVDLLRRDGDITIDGGNGGLSFVGLVEGISDWFDMGEQMYDPKVDAMLRKHDDNQKGGANEHHPRSGIAAQIDVRARGHFLIPPRSLRSLPPSRP